MEQIISVKTEPIELKIKVEQEPIVIDAFENELRGFMNGELSGEFIIPDGVTRIGGSFFAGLGITNIIIPDSVQSIGANAFNQCQQLLSVNIPNGVTAIGTSTFYSCRRLAEITIPDTVTSIGESAFMLCQSLQNIRLPSGLTAIPNSCFLNCTGLRHFELPPGITSIGLNAFRSCHNLCRDSQGERKSFVVPEGVTEIGAGAFADINSNLDLTLPDSLESIGAFGRTLGTPTIRCHAGTYAYNWAIEQHFNVVVIPDV